MLKCLKKIFNKKGFVSIEAIISGVLILMIVFLSMGFYSMIYPRMLVEKEVNVLAQKAKIQGGLTNETSQPVNSDIAILKKDLKQIGYNPDDIEITAKTNPGSTNAIGVAPLDSDSENYIKRDSNEIIQIVVKVPANQFIKGPLKFFKSEGKVTKFHYIKQSVMSERW